MQLVCIRCWQGVGFDAIALLKALLSRECSTSYCVSIPPAQPNFATVSPVTEFHWLTEGELVYKMLIFLSSWSMLTFRRLWHHENLNEATHHALHCFFSGVNMTLLHAITQQGIRGHVATNFPEVEDLVTPERLQRLKGIPIFFFSGSENKAWSPESTDLSYGLLRHTFGKDDYERCVVEGYGHLDCWMSTRAHIDVYPLVRERVDLICRGKRYHV
jgi:hypothetical protein